MTPSHNRYTVLIVMIAAMGSVTYGYCSVIISSTLASKLLEIALRVGLESR
jgi:hypothetical protein